MAPLALTLGLHLLLVLAWVAAPHNPIHNLRGLQAVRERASTFVLVRPAPAPRLKRVAEAALVRPRDAVPVALRRPAPAMAASSAPEAAAQAADTEAADNEAADAKAAPAEAVSAQVPATAAPGDVLATSKRMAGGVDRALRNGSSPITAEPDRKWERFAAAFAAARTSVSRDTVLESYTAADGVTFYRKTVGNRVACYRSGSVGGLGPADGRSAGSVSCPAGAIWTRH